MAGALTRKLCVLTNQFGFALSGFGKRKATFHLSLGVSTFKMPHKDPLTFGTAFEKDQAEISYLLKVGLKEWRAGETSKPTTDP
jgi:hypothetical protein